jgi:hypothetical protein
MKKEFNCTHNIKLFNLVPKAEGIKVFKPTHWLNNGQWEEVTNTSNDYWLGDDYWKRQIRSISLIAPGICVVETESTRILKGEFEF